ncbi:component of the polarisome [Rhizopus azygosporus]|uniref:Component of the polarisome n=1 Tax=Rhizopus azygosporus TaxID=86630 RepID=A0A367KG12_RHIAZ|nr:component of the polarisome [Rhizopus azygosporus]
MAYSKSPPRSPQEDWLSRGPQSAKTYSTSSSRSMSYTSRSQSFASTRAYSLAHYENTARIYYMELRSYLKDILAQESIEGPQPERITARQKLTRLSNHQFHELAMDVYDEVTRRIKNDKYVPFLPVKEDFHPKRNQARQKLATIAVPRFKDLASDVFSELTRRYANLFQEDDSHLPPVPQMPMMDSKLYDKVQQPSKSTHIIPAKGTFNVETVDKFSDDETILNSPDRTYVNRSPIDQKEFFSRNNNSDEDVEKIRSEYEYKMSMMQNHIKQLQDKLEEKNDQRMDSIDRELLDQLQKVSLKDEEDQRVIRQMEEQYKKLDDKYQTLKQDYNKQQEAVREVKRETREMIEELKRMAKTNEELMLEKEEADKEIKTLRDQVKEWQIKYEKVRLELRSVKAQSIRNVSSINCNMIKDNFIQPTKKGIITYDHILSFQTSIDELLITARSSYPANVIQAMKVIVSVCKLITEQVENNENRLTTDSKQTLYELKSRFSTALSDLLIAAKHHANGMGISPVSLLDHSAGNLSAVVVDLVRLVGMKDTDNNNQKGFQNDYNNNNTTSAYETNSNSPPSLSQIRSQLKDTDDNYSLPEQTYITPAELTVS